MQGCNRHVETAQRSGTRNLIQLFCGLWSLVATPTHYESCPYRRVTVILKRAPPPTRRRRCGASALPASVHHSIALSKARTRRSDHTTTAGAPPLAFPRPLLAARTLPATLSSPLTPVAVAWPDRRCARPQPWPLRRSVRWPAPGRGWRGVPAWRRVEGRGG